LIFRNACVALAFYSRRMARRELTMDRVLVVVYSCTGTGRRLAQLLCAQQQWPMGEVTEIRPRRGASGTWRSVIDSLFRRRPDVRYDGPAPEQFETVVLIAPVWLLRLAGPMRSFVASRHASLPKAAVLMVMGSRGAAQAVAEIARLTGRGPLLDAGFTNREVEDGSCAGRLQALGDALRTIEDPVVGVRSAVWSPQAA
jgi:hypothetical protein